jgi:hypothetical protein
MIGYLKLSEKTEEIGSIHKSVTLYRTPDHAYHAMVMILSPLFLSPERLPATFPRTSQDLDLRQAREIYESSQDRCVAEREAFPDSAPWAEEPK